MTLWREDSHDQTEMFWMGSDPALRHSLETPAGYSMLQMKGRSKSKNEKRKKTLKKMKLRCVMFFQTFHNTLMKKGNSSTLKTLTVEIKSSTSEKQVNDTFSPNALTVQQHKNKSSPFIFSNSKLAKSWTLTSTHLMSNLIFFNK